MNYEYINDLDGISQYDDFDLENNKIINARYIHALVHEDKVGYLKFFDSFINKMPFDRCIFHVFIFILYF